MTSFSWSNAQGTGEGRKLMADVNTSAKNLLENPSQEYNIILDLRNQLASCMREKEIMKIEVERYKSEIFLITGEIRGGKKRRRKKTKKRKSKRKTRKRKKNKRVCCAGPGCPEWMHCIHVLGDKDSGIKPKSKKTLKKMKGRVKTSPKKYIRSVKRKRIKGGSRKQTLIEGHHELM